MDLREHVAGRLVRQAAAVAADAAAALRGDGRTNADREYAQRIADILVRLLASAVRDGKVQADKGLIADLRSALVARGIGIDRLFTFVYSVERAALDELALDPTAGAPTEPWPLVTQLVHRASFDLLAAYTDRDRPEPGASICDPLTTLHTRSVLEAALAKELDRAARNGGCLSLLLIDVDRLGAINQAHGHGVGDRVLERLAALLRSHFRRHDWLARFSEGAIAVLLAGADEAGARDLAENVRVSVRERLAFTGQAAATVRLTVSVGVLSWNADTGIRDAERLAADAEAALQRAKRGGGDRVETVVYPSRSS